MSEIDLMEIDEDDEGEAERGDAERDVAQEINSFIVPDGLEDDDDDDDMLGQLTDEGDVPVAGVGEGREFTRYLLPFLLIVDTLSSQTPLFINYMCVLIDDHDDTIRGLKRLHYFCNSGNARYVSNVMLGYRLALVRQHCRIDIATFLTLRKCFQNNTHQGHDAQQAQGAAGIGGLVNQRLTKLDSVLAFLTITNSTGRIEYNYPAHIIALAEECNVNLAQRPVGAGAPAPALPYFLFYEFCEKEGNTVRNHRDCAGYSTHQDFPALRLLRLMWINSGSVEDARRMYEIECGAGHNLQLDRMHHMLTID